MINQAHLLYEALSFLRDEFIRSPEDNIRYAGQLCKGYMKTMELSERFVIESFEDTLGVHDIDSFMKLRSEIMSSAEDMVKIGLFNLPYEKIYFELPLKTMLPDFGVSHMAIMASENSDGDLAVIPFARFTGIPGAHPTRGWTPLHIRLDFGVDGKRLSWESNGLVEMDPDPDKIEWLKGFSQLAADMLLILVVTLATRGVRTKERKPPVGWTGRSGDFSPRTAKRTGEVGHTSIILRAADDTGGGDPSHGGDRSGPRLHLRRGHLAWQHYGPGGAKVKRIFRQPMLVGGIDGGGGHIDHDEYRL